jgi:hypothetical protein
MVVLGRAESLLTRVRVVIPVEGYRLISLSLSLGVVCVCVYVCAYVAQRSNRMRHYSTRLTSGSRVRVCTCRFGADPGYRRRPARPYLRPPLT